MRFTKLIGLAALLPLIVACGTAVEVPPAHVGKILTKNGYAPDTIPPSKFRLPACWAYCDKLVLLEVSDSMLRESMPNLFMPLDKLKLSEFEIRGTFSIPREDKAINAIFDRIVPVEVTDRIWKISAAIVYETYGKQAVRGVARSEIVKHSIPNVLAQRESIGSKLHVAIGKKLKETKTPIKITRFEIASALPPSVIVDAQEAAKKREIDIQQAEADAEVQLVEAEKALEVAKKDRLVEREKAEAIAEQNEIAAKSITPQLLAYRRLEVAERIYTELAKSSNVVIVPADSGMFDNLTDDAVLAKLLGKELRR